MTTNEETEALIMELRTTASDARAYARHALSRGRGIESANYDAEAGLYERAADGLAALTTPQDGGDALEARQPNDEGEYILRLIETIKQTGGSVEIRGVKIVPCDEYGRTAAVPGATTEQAFKKAEAFDKAVALSERRQTLLKEAEAERDAALAAVERCRALVAEWKHEGPSGPFPDRIAIDVGVEVIEPLLAALDGAPEPDAAEKKYAIEYSSKTRTSIHEQESLESARTELARIPHPNGRIMQQVVAPWLPVEGESDD